MDNLNVKTFSECIEQGVIPEILFWVGCAGSFDESQIGYVALLGRLPLVVVRSRGAGSAVARLQFLDVVHSGCAVDDLPWELACCGHHCHQP